MRLLSHVLALATLSSRWTSAQPAADPKRCKPGHTYIYGVADNSQIYEVDVARHTARSVLDVSEFAGGGEGGLFNSCAWDGKADTLYCMNTVSEVFAWVRYSGAAGIVAPSQSTTGFNPANAAFFGGAYWFVETTARPETNLTLVRLAFTPPATRGGLPTPAGRTRYSVALTTVGGAPFTARNGYGDIAVSKAGDLYITPVVLDPGVPGSGPLLVLRNLNRLVASGDDGSATATAVAQTGLPGPQLSFDCTGWTLWGQTYGGCEWSTIDTATGVLTPRFNLSLPGAPDPTKCLRDLGGAACTCAGAGLV